MSTFVPRHLARRSVHPWMLAWLGGPLIGIANGVAREVIYKDHLGDQAAHQVSTGSAIGLFAVYFWLLDRRWPLASRREALGIGAGWVGLTVMFEFVFGHYVDGKSWAELGRDYNVAEGRLWPLVLLWLGVGPLAVRELRRR